MPGTSWARPPDQTQPRPDAPLGLVGAQPQAQPAAASRGPLTTRQASPGSIGGLSGTTQTLQRGVLVLYPAGMTPALITAIGSAIAALAALVRAFRTDQRVTRHERAHTVAAARAQRAGQQASQAPDNG